MDGIQTPFSESVKYLGVTLKSKLTRKPHPYTNTNKEKFGSFFSRALAYEVNGFPR